MLEKSATDLSKSWWCESVHTEADGIKIAENLEGRKIKGEEGRGCSVRRTTEFLLVCLFFEAGFLCVPLAALDLIVQTNLKPRDLPASTSKGSHSSVSTHSEKIKRQPGVTPCSPSLFTDWVP